LRQVSVSSDIKTIILDLKAVIERENLASTNVIPDPTTLFSALPRQVLEQELFFCNQRSQQAQVLLRQAQEQLQLSQLAIQRQEILTQTLQARIDQLERDLQDVHSSSEELRARLKRQQHHTSQLKAALERLLDTSLPKDITDKNKADALINLEAIAEISFRSLQLLAAK
jgi:chromosome segregation ATPase